MYIGTIQSVKIKEWEINIREISGVDNNLLMHQKMNSTEWMKVMNWKWRKL
jgi:hypothetical protein